MLNQFPALSCNRTPWRGFSPIEEQSLIGFVHEGDRDKPVVMVVHGLFDSNTNRYVRVIASRLADDGFTVVTPDMRWHGCHLREPALGTAGFDESSDLAQWAKLLHARYHRPVGLLGVSIGALASINTAARYDVFDAGTIAVSPPAAVRHVVDLLDRPPTFAEHGLNKFFVLYFRGVLRLRDRRAGLPFWSAKPFQAYLDHVTQTHARPFPATTGELLAAVEPVTLLRDVKQPLLIIAADNDPIMTVESATALRDAARDLPLVQVVETAEGGHAGIIGLDPQWFSDAIELFFSNSAFVSNPR